MTVDGGGLYFAEGVLATIEVKSTLKTESLNESLDNCKSVLDLAITGEHPHEADARIKQIMGLEKLDYTDAEQRFWYRFRPATYIFAFKSDLTAETTATKVQEWWQANHFAHSAFFPLLPRVIVTGNAVGIVNDGWLTLQTNLPDGQVQDGPGTSVVTTHVMTAFSSKMRFRWLAFHIMYAVSARLGLKNFGEEFQYRFTDYFPMDAYLKPLQAPDIAASTRFIHLTSRIAKSSSITGSYGQ